MAENISWFFVALKLLLASRTSGTFGFARKGTTAIAKPKEPYFANAKTKIGILPEC